jgi:hypothetical protein
MAARPRKTVAAPVEIQEEVPVVTAVEENVYEPEVSEDEPAKGKPGRKVDPLNAALKEFKDAKASVELARTAVPLDQAEARFEAARAELAKLMEL